MLNFFNKKACHAGIQITENHIFLCVTKKGKENIIPSVACYFQACPSLNEPSFATSLRRIKKKIPRRSKIILGLPSAQLLKKEFSLDASLTSDEIFLYLKQHATHFFNHSYETIYLDFFSLPENTTGEQTVLTASCLRENVDPILLTMKNNRISVSAIDCIGYAMQRAIQTVVKPAPDVFSVFYFDSQALFFFVYQKKRLVYESFEKNNDAMKLWKQYFDSDKFISLEMLCLIGKRALISKIEKEIHQLTNIKIVKIDHIPPINNNDFLISYGLSLWSEHGV